MNLIQLIALPSDLCICEHWREDHDLKCKCTVIEHDRDCFCKYFMLSENGDEGYYWFTDDQGRKEE